MCPSRGTDRRSLLLCLFLAVSPLRLTDAAPSNADLIDYLGGTATGQALETAAYTLTVLANETDVLVSFAVDRKVAEVGWLGWGAGTAMTDADIVICWPNSDASWTLSHRVAPSTVMPTLVGTASSKDPSVDSSGSLRVVPSLSSTSSTDSPAVVTWSRPLKLPPGYKGKGTAFQLQRSANQPMIYAYGPKNPGKAAQDADLAQHALDAMGGTYLDLSATFTDKTSPIDPPLTPVKGAPPTSGTASKATQQSGGTGSVSATAGVATPGRSQSVESGGVTSSAATTSPTLPGGGATASASNSSDLTAPTGAAGNDLLTYSNLILIHAICAGVAWTILAPFGILCARYGRGPPGTTLTRFPWHFDVQGYLTTPTTLIALGAVLMAVQAKGGDSGSTFAHKTLGFFFVGGLIVQDLLGLWTHLDHPPSRPGRPPPPRAARAWIHMFLGVALIVTGYFQVLLGMERYGISNELVTYGFYG
ncbi:hypothetical protein JCM3774_001667 [Rhodotorula dairenensis]